MGNAPFVLRFCKYGTATLLAAVSIGLAACAEPRARAYRREAVYEPPPPPPTRVIFYPANGQTPEQQDRDRYECYQWAVAQTGFDPSRPHVAHQHFEVVPSEPAGHDAATGAVTGALLGAAVSRPREALGGAIIGAVAGTIIGASSDAAREDQAARIQQHYDARDAQYSANIEAQAANYRRAMSACVEGRGYRVK